MNKIFKLISVIILLLTTSIAFAAGGSRTGTAGATQLLIPVGPRGIAMGESNLVTASGIEALYWNPAGVSHMTNSADVMFSYMSYIADIGVQYGAVAANFEGFGTVSFAVKSLSVGDIAVTTTSNPDGTGETFSPTEIVAGFSYSKMLTDAISVGLTANFVTETLAEVNATGLSFDFGVIYNNLADISGLSIGVVAKNFGTDMTFDGTGLYQVVSEPPYNVNRYLTVQAAAFQMPFNFQLAAGYKRPLNDLNTLEVTGIYMNNNFSPDEYKFGAEYGYNKMFFLRAGYQFASNPGDSFGESNYLYGFTAGAGFNYNVEGFSVKIDYAYRYAQFFDGNNVFALTLGF